MAKAKDKKPTCGIIMPISEIDGCPSEHWAEVLALIKCCAKDEGFDVNLVSDAEEVGIIQKRIVQNIYTSDIVVCDVSGRNPNVMFELGMSLAFDKPTIVIKDDKTDFSFDTSPVEHLGYPRDLRYATIVSFQTNLRRKMKSAHSGDNSHSYLKSFGGIKTVVLDSTEVSAEAYLVSGFNELRAEVRSLASRLPSTNDNDVNRAAAEKYAAKYLLMSKGDQFSYREGMYRLVGAENLDLMQEEIMRQGKFAAAEEFILGRAQAAQARIQEEENEH